MDIFNRHVIHPTMEKRREWGKAEGKVAEIFLCLIKGVNSWRRKWQPTLVLLPGESHGQRSLVGYSPRDPKESDMTERLRFTSLHFTFPSGSVVKNLPATQEPQETRVQESEPFLTSRT